MRRIGLDPARPYVLYTCSNPGMTEAPETRVRHRLDRGVCARAATSGCGGRDRDPPSSERRRRLARRRPRPASGTSPSGRREGGLPVTDEARTVFFDSLAHSAAVVGINTTAMIEAAIVGKSVLTVLARGVRPGDDAALQLPARGERRLPARRLVARRAHCAARPRPGRRRRRTRSGAAASCSRSCGRTGSTARRRRSWPTWSRSSRRCPPIPRRARRSLRLALMPEAAASSLVLRLKPVRRRLRRMRKLRRRIVGKARRYGLLPG